MENNIFHNFERHFRKKKMSDQIFFRGKKKKEKSIVPKTVPSYFGRVMELRSSIQIHHDTTRFESVKQSWKHGHESM